MIKIAICDDETLYTDRIISLLYEENVDFEIDVFSNGNDFLCAADEYNIIFMDIELPDTNGIRLLKENPHNGIIIILTSHEEEALNGYYIRAFRFLVKPIDTLLFHEAVSSAINELKKEVSIEVTDEQNIINKISIQNIVYAEAGDKKTGIRTLTKFYYTTTQINRLYEILNADFYFVHRSYIVNMNYVSKIDVKKRTVTMQEQSIIAVSRLKWKDFRETFYKHIKIKMNGG